MNLTHAFHDQSVTCTRMGSPFTGLLLKILSEEWDSTSALGRAMATYDGDIGPAGHSLPLRIAGGLHALVLKGENQGLRAVYPPNTADEAALRVQVLNALKSNEEFLLEWTKLPPQTNEIRRSAALMAMARVAVDRFDLPIVLSELGASGGLNLLWDSYAVDLNGEIMGSDPALVTFKPEWKGPLPPRNNPRIATRGGVDLNPLDPTDAEDQLRLASYLWSDQPYRLEMLRSAGPHQVHEVEKGDAIEWLKRRLETPRHGHLHLIQHTVAWQYFPAEAQAEGLRLIETAGAQATNDAPIGWMQMETDGDRTGKIGAALTLRLWPGNITLTLGRADFHGRWIEWQG